MDLYPTLPLKFNGNVSSAKDFTSEEWNWYATYTFYKDEEINEYFQEVYDMFIPRFQKLGIFKSLRRIKLNCYPRTETLREHKAHTDYGYGNHHYGAVFSLNTCDGFTRLPDGSKANSIANRIVFFDAGKKHNSSTTTTKSARYNINFNFL